MCYIYEACWKWWGLRQQIYHCNGHPRNNTNCNGRARRVCTSKLFFPSPNVDAYKYFVYDQSNAKQWNCRKALIVNSIHITSEYNNTFQVGKPFLTYSSIVDLIIKVKSINFNYGWHIWRTSPLKVFAAFWYAKEAYQPSSFTPPLLRYTGRDIPEIIWMPQTALTFLNLISVFHYTVFP